MKYQQFFEDLDKQVLYHGFKDEHQLEKALRLGLQVDDDGMIYLSEKPYPLDAPYAYTKYYVEVTIPDKSYLADWREFWEDDLEHTYDYDNPYYVYTSNIPPNYLKRIR